MMDLQVPSMIRAALKRYVDWIPVALILLALASLPWLLVKDARLRSGTLQAVQEEGKLRVLTNNGPVTYYVGPDGPLGFEYDLTRAFAEHLGVKLELVIADNFTSLLPKLLNGDAHMAAAGITITKERKKFLQFSRSYQTIKQQVVYLRGSLNPPRRVRDLIGRQLEVVAGSSFVERLLELKVKYPKLTWIETSTKSPEELLFEVWQGLLEHTIADSNIISVVRQFYPKLQLAFRIQKPEQLAWAFPLVKNNSLLEAANQFLRDMDADGELERLRERYYGPASRFNYFNVIGYMQRIEDTLPIYKELFVVAGKLHDIDWRLLAAQGYQESQWDPDAVSPTGVRGIMQLTVATATKLKVADRVDPAQSIEGGARYLRELIDRVPDGVPAPDRFWFALAAYNVGYGHLEDARKITQKNGKDPGKWADVKESLPLLSRAKWYRKTKYGYARGYEPVAYVTRIRSFYDILVKIDAEAKTLPEPDKLSIEVPAL